LMGTMAGRPAVEAMDVPSAALAWAVDRNCLDAPSWWTEQDYYACAQSALTDADVLQESNEVVAAFERNRETLDPVQNGLVGAALGLRVAELRTLHHSSIGRPGVSVLADYRLDDAALDELLLERTGSEARLWALNFLSLANTDRSVPLELISRLRRGSGRDAEEARAELEREFASRREVAVSNSSVQRVLDAMAVEFDEQSRRYREARDTEDAIRRAIGHDGVGPALVIELPLIGSGAETRVAYEQAAAQSFSARRMRIALDLFDRLLAHAGGLGARAEQLVAYTLLSMVSPPRREMRLRAEINPTHPIIHTTIGLYEEAGFTPIHVFASGAQVTPAVGGLFDVETLLRTEE